MEFNATKEAILTRVSVLDLIGETVQLKQANGRASGLCPFHEESTPSFYVYDDRFYCFGCKASGDAIEFVRKQQNCGFIDALLYLGNKYGVDVSGLKTKNNRTPRHKTYSQAMQIAHDYYRQCLLSPAGKQARAYLEGRQITSDDMRRYGLGYAPATGNALALHLRQQQIKTQDAQAVSLLSYNRDFFRNRLMFPIHDSKGAVVGFAGRALANDDKIKYLNSRENDLFHKKKTLFGLSSALAAIAAQKAVIVVEGYFDWLRLHKEGLENVVCCMGTAFSSQHLKIIKRYVKEVILLFDGDRAGAEAAAHAVSLVYSAPDLQFNVCQLPAGDDPDSYLLRAGKDAMLDYLQANLTHVPDFFINHKFKHNRSEQYPQIMRNEILPFLRLIRTSMEKDLIISKVSEASGISIEQIEKSLRQRQHLPSKPSTAPAVKLSPLLEEFIGHLYYAVYDERRHKEVEDFVDTLRLSPSFAELVGFLLANLRAGNKNTEHDFSDFADKVVELVAKIKRNARAYACHNHYDAIKKIIATITLRKERSNIRMLHQKLQGKDDDLRVLAEISTLQKHTDKILTLVRNDDHGGR
ncbi:MAG: DNA primase [Pseudomonadota bacterium]|nr:DNA primase [Pseudomonadota bacterium]